MKGSISLWLIVFILLPIQYGKAQNLIHSFTEFNSTGKSMFGEPASSAGDVNGDGYDDYIISAPIYDQNRGKTYIFFGGETTDEVADVEMTGEDYNNWFGTSVAGMGDLNGDGFDDVAIGAPYYNSDKGRVYIYFGGDSIDNEADLILQGENINTNFGISISNAGDLNNDGFNDLIVGAFSYNSNKGRAYVYFGGQAMDNTADVILTGENSNDKFGWAVAGTGDVNQDGFDDFIIGAYGYNSDTGRAYFYLGGETVDNIPDLTMTGEDEGHYFGFSVSSAGDVNNDGYADIAVGAYYCFIRKGRAYIYLGSENTDNVADLQMEGKDSCDSFGFSLATAGDYNGDGYDDIVIGAPGYNSATGRIHIFFGGDPMNNVPDLVLTGEEELAYFGYSVSKAGNINKDEFDDIITGAHRYNNDIGKGYIYFGNNVNDTIPDVLLNGETTNNNFGSSASGIGDVNGDGYEDFAIGADGFENGKGKVYLYFGDNHFDTIADEFLTGEATIDFFGSSIAGVGDLNNDGFDDLVVGAYGYNDYTGRAYLFFGGNPMDNIPDLIFTGEDFDNNFGYSVAGAVDMNSDGFNDLLIGAYGYDNYRGRVYLYLGGNSMDDIADVIFDGEIENSEFGWSVSGAGDVNNDGYNDMIVGADNYSSENGRAYIFTGGNTIDNEPDVVLENSSYFGTSVSGAVDLNNDGYDDVIVGEVSHDSTPGNVFIYYGGADMDSTLDVTLTSETASRSFGCMVSGIRDYNNDGFDDVLVGDYGYNSNIGRAYLFFGGDNMNPIADIVIDGEKEVNSRFGYSGSGAFDANGDGSPEFVVGAFSYPANGKVYLYSSKQIEIVALNTDLQNLTLNDGESQCYNALQNITIAGKNPVDFTTGSTVTLIAGNSIRFLPGFHAQLGSWMDAHITTDNSFCDAANKSMLLAQVEEKSIAVAETEAAVVIPGGKSIKIYPNPNNGQFFLEVSNFETRATVSIYNMLGSKVYESEMTNEISHKINLLGIKKGVYFVKAIDQKEQFTRKMIVN